MSLTIHDQHLHLWCLPLDQIPESSALEQYKNILSSVERARMKRFVFAKDRYRFLMTRVLVRTTLSHYASITPQDWIFKASAEGKPAIANDHVEANTLSFNLSHTHNLILLGVTRDRALGVDVEHISNQVNALDIAAQCFAYDEYIALQTAPEDQRAEQFLKYWTLKEAYVKACGQGLSIPLNCLSFHFHEKEDIQCSMDPRLNDCPSRWQFWQFQPTPEHIASICVAKNAGVLKK